MITTRPPWIDPYSRQRRPTREVRIGEVGIGGGNPIRVQSMITTDTLDTAASVAATLSLAAAGCEIVRITAQTVRHAANLEHIVAAVRAAGCSVPIVADIHFKPDAAMEAVKWVDKIRVNPGNYVDKKKFAVIEYTDEDYAGELARIDASFTPLVRECKARGRAMRIGTNHGSLSDRIMNRFGDTPLGMVESALEFARIARAQDYHDFVFSMKASNPKVMIEAYRLLVTRLDAEGPDWNYPIHLGVTEAGDGEDGRIKSAIGIGALLLDGIGDTIRVSLTEDSEEEIPVCRAIIDRFAAAPASPASDPSWPAPRFDPFDYRRRASAVQSCGAHDFGGDRTVRVFAPRPVWDALAHKLDRLGDFKPEIILEDAGVHMIDPREALVVDAINAQADPCIVSVADGVPMDVVPAFRLLAARVNDRHAILLKDTLVPPPAGSAPPFLGSLLAAATNLGALLCDGIGDAVMVRGEPAPGQSLRLAYNVLQGSGTRIFKTDYVACPSCGRTLFNLQSTTRKIREATGHLKGVRIAVMGCIVNGPGEMADADFGYVGGAPGKINLYVGKTAVQFNIPEDEAVDRLIDLIKEHNRWIDIPAAGHARQV